MKKTHKKKKVFGGTTLLPDGQIIKKKPLLDFYFNHKKVEAKNGS